MTRRFFITEAVYEKNLGTLRNEYDILLGKLFTVDPISKRRLENLGDCSSADQPKCYREAPCANRGRC